MQMVPASRFLNVALNLILQGLPKPQPPWPSLISKTYKPFASLSPCAVPNSVQYRFLSILRS